MLGILHDHLNNGKEKHKAAMFRIRRAVAAIICKEAPNQGISYVIERVIIPRAEFVGSRKPWSLAQCMELDVPINVLIKIRSKNMVGYPTALLYLNNKDYCGLGMTQLSQSIQEGKNRMLHAASVSPDPYLQAVAEAIVDRAARQAGMMAMRSQDFVVHWNPMSSSWLSSTLQFHQQAGCLLYQAGELRSGVFTSPSTLAMPMDIVQQVLPPSQMRVEHMRSINKTNVNNYGDLISYDVEQDEYNWSEELGNTRIGWLFDTGPCDGDTALYNTHKDRMDESPVRGMNVLLPG